MVFEWLNSLWVTPVPALMSCASPGRITAPEPMLSWWASAPSSTQVRISHVAVRVRREAAARRDPIVVQDAQRAPLHPRRVVVVAEREAVPSVEPGKPRHATVGRASRGVRWLGSGSD